MNEVGRKNGHKREPFFFERLEALSLPEATTKELKQKQETFHWTH